MPATHLRAWELHFQEFPPGDFHTQTLLAQLIMMVEAMFASKESKPRKLEQIAPWLFTPSMRKQAETARLATQMRAVRAIMDEES